MKITDEMIHPDIRRQGVMLRKLFRFKNEKSFARSQKMLDRTKRFMRTKNLIAEERFIETDDNPRLRVCVYRGKGSRPNATGLLWLHGGGYAIGAPEQDLSYIQGFINTANCVVVAPDYRLSIRQPYPAALNDSYQALLWMKENASELGIRSDQLFIGGNSAGGGLAVATALMARDKGTIRLAFQMPFYPMLDDRMRTPSAQDNDAPVWDSVSNQIAWKMYLGSMHGTESVPVYAAPARETDFSGLPSAYTFVGDIEPFFDETKEYIERLQAAGVSAQLDSYPGCFHGFNVAFPKAPVAVEARLRYLKAFKAATEHCFAKQP